MCKWGVHRASLVMTSSCVSLYVFVKIRRHQHQHTRVHARTQARIATPEPPTRRRRHHIPRLVRGQAFHTQTTLGSPSLCGRPKGGIYIRGRGESKGGGALYTVQHHDTLKLYNTVIYTELSHLPSTICVLVVFYGAMQTVLRSGQWTPTN